MSNQLPESVLPGLRAKWVRLGGAREVAQHAVDAAQRIETDYQTTLTTVLNMLGLDQATNWKVNLETGEIAEATEADVAGGQRNGTPAPVPVG